jgi:hypothetical protein
VRGEFGLAREITETFLREAERGARTTEYGVGRRLLGCMCFWRGDFIEAQANLVEALSIYDPERDREARFGFGPDYGAAVRAYLATTKWLLGEVGPGRALIEEAVPHATETGHVSTLVHIYFYKAHFEIVRGDAGAARRAAEIVVKLSQENALTLSARARGFYRRSTRPFMPAPPRWSSCQLGLCSTEVRHGQAISIKPGHLFAKNYPQLPLKADQPNLQYSHKSVYISAPPCLLFPPQKSMVMESSYVSRQL